MNTDTSIGNQFSNIEEELFSINSFRPKIIEIRTEEDIYNAAVYLLQKKEQDSAESKEYIESGEATNSICILKKILFDIWLRKNDAIGAPFVIIIEGFYVDRVYRDSYCSHFASKHFDLDRFCQRVFFLEGVLEEDFFGLSEEILSEKFLGTCVIRATPEGGNIIGQTLLKPNIFCKCQHDYVCVAPYTVTMFGKRLKISAFPYMMQDGEVITCAETTLIHLLDYYSRRYSSYRAIVPSDLYKIEDELSFERMVPSNGMTYQTVSHVLNKLNFYPRLYGFKKPNTIVNKRIMHHYIDSAIPVAVSLNTKSQNESHSIVAIGISDCNKNDIKKLETTSVGKLHFLDMADISNEYIVMNDSSAPYAKMYIENQNETFDQADFRLEDVGHSFKLTSIIAPLARRMFLDDQNAASIALDIISHKKVGIHKALNILDVDKYNGLGTKNNPILYRLLLVRAGSFRRKRSYYMNQKSLQWQVYSSIPLPKFVWVCEIYSLDSLKAGKAIGEVVIDATSKDMAGISSAIIINYPYRFAFRTPDENVDYLIKRYSSNMQRKYWEEIVPYAHFKDPEFKNENN